MVDYSQIEDPNPLDTVVYFFTGLGHEAVIIFFVLSGFFVGGSTINAGRNFSFVNYGITRLARLWTVLLPALVLTLIIDSLLAMYFPEIQYGAMREIWNSGPDRNTYATDLWTFIGNAFFLQTIVVPVFGSNGPLWSLANEFWYYVMFPLFLFAFGRIGVSTSLGLRIFCGFLAPIIFLSLPSSITDYFAVWLIGVLAYYLHKLIRHHWLPFSISGCLFTAALAISQVTALTERLPFTPDLLIGISFGVFCMYLANSPAQEYLPRRIIRAIHVASEMSYSLYLIHFPIIVLGAATLLHSKQLQPTPIGYGYYLMATGAILITGMLFWHTFERRTPMIKQFIYSQTRSKNPKI